jgi:hypothetical protein
MARYAVATGIETPRAINFNTASIPRHMSEFLFSKSFELRNFLQDFTQPLRLDTAS